MSIGLQELNRREGRSSCSNDINNVAILGPSCDFLWRTRKTTGKEGKRGRWRRDAGKGEG